MQQLIRSGAVALVAGGVMGLLAVTIGLLSAFSAAMRGLGPLALWLDLAANIALTLGFVALYLRQSDQVGTLGLIGFLGSFFGTCLSIAVSALELYNPAYGAIQLRDPLFLAFVVVADIGFIALAIAMIRAAVLPRWQTWAFLLTSISTNTTLLGPSAALVTAVGFMIWSIALAAMGLTLLSEQRRFVGTAQRAVG